MGIFSRLFGSGDKIQVLFVNNADESTIGKASFGKSDLPETFELETTMSVDDRIWTVVKAEPVHSKDFIQTGKLTLWLQEIQQMNINDLKYSIPTVSNEFPIYGGKIPADFEGVSIQSDDWRQIEFLAQSSSSEIEIELQAIKDIIANHSVETTNYLLFQKCHVRSTIGLPQLQLKLDDVLSLLPEGQIVKGCAVVEDGVLIANSFTLKTPATIYYGTEENGVIDQLCIESVSEGTWHEINTLTAALNLIAVNWREAQILAHDE